MITGICLIWFAIGIAALGRSKNAQQEWLGLAVAVIPSAILIAVYWP